jgi:hypothetical protein
MSPISMICLYPAACVTIKIHQIVIDSEPKYKCTINPVLKFFMLGILDNDDIPASFKTKMRACNASVKTIIDDLYVQAPLHYKHTVKEVEKTKQAASDKKAATAMATDRRHDES